ncbi:MAG: PAS domain-containing protein [Phycisphaerae bacterium]|jgi:PAS domain S-box-containing protein
MKKRSVASKVPGPISAKGLALESRREQCEGLKRSLSELQRQWAIHFSQGPSANVIVDAQLRIREVNKVFLTALGLNRDEVIGGLATKFVAPEMRAEVRRRLARGARGRRQKHIELDLVGKSGRRTFLFFHRMIPIFQAGKIDGHLISAMDITGRKRIDQARQETQEYLRLVFEHTNDGISIKEAAPPGNHWKLVMCNDRFVEMSGRSREKLMADYGKKALLVHENVPGQWATRQRKPDAGKKTCRGIDSWIRPDGRENYHE